MKRITPTLMFTLVVAIVAVAAVATSAPILAASPAATAGYDRLKSLVGVWEAKGPDGATVTATFKLVAGGTAVEETSSHGNMVTVYHLDGDSVLLTHYCMADNQPRMRAKGLSADGKSLDFQFVDATNLAKPTDMHMHALKMTFVDADHVTEEWVHSADGKEEPMLMPLVRKK